MTGLLDGLLDQLGQLPLWAVLLAVCLVMALETTMLVGIVVPGDVVVLFAAATADGPVELGLLVVAVTAGSLTGETLGFGLGRRWGDRLRSSRAGRRLGEERWARAADFLHQRGGPAVFLARYLAAVHAVTPIVAGTVGMRYRRFIAWCAAGGLTWSALYVALGGAAGASYRRYADDLGTATSVALVGLAVLVGVAVLGSALRSQLRPAAEHSAEHGPEPAPASEPEPAHRVAPEPAALDGGWPPAPREPVGCGQLDASGTNSASFSA